MKSSAVSAVSAVSVLTLAELAFTWVTPDNASSTSVSVNIHAKSFDEFRNMYYQLKLITDNIETYTQLVTDESKPRAYYVAAYYPSVHSNCGKIACLTVFGPSFTPLSEDLVKLNDELAISLQ